MFPCLERVDAPVAEGSGRLEIDGKTYDSAAPILRQTFDTLVPTNVVCTARFAPLNIKQMAWTQRAFCRPATFPSVIGHSATPSASVTSFRPGYFRCAGGNSPERATEVITACAMRMTIETGMPMRVFNFSVHNYVSACTFPCHINVEKMRALNPLEFRLTTLFPGLICPLKSPELLATVFATGKINLVGARRPEHPVQALVHLFPTLMRCRVFTFSSMAVPADAMSAATVWVTSEMVAASAAQHPNVVLTHECLHLCDKKAERSRKELQKKRKDEMRALSDRRSDLRRQIKRRRVSYTVPAAAAATAAITTDDRKAPARGGGGGTGGRRKRSTAGGGDDELDIDMGVSDDEDDLPRSLVDLLKKELRRIQRRLDDAPALDTLEAAQRFAVFALTLCGRARTYSVQITPWGLIKVLDADDEAEADEALRLVQLVLPAPARAPIPAASPPAAPLADMPALPLRRFDTQVDS